MKGAFRKVTKDGPPVKEVIKYLLLSSMFLLKRQKLHKCGIFCTDKPQFPLSCFQVDSAVSAPIVDVQSLSLIPMNTRSKRASKKTVVNCNDEQLREIIENNIGPDAKTSKRQIQKAAEKELGGKDHVIVQSDQRNFRHF